MVINRALAWWRGEARGDFAGVAKARLEGGSGLAIEDGDRMPIPGEVVGDGGADDAAAENDDVHEREGFAEARRIAKTREREPPNRYPYTLSSTRFPSPCARFPSPDS